MTVEVGHVVAQSSHFGLLPPKEVPLFVVRLYYCITYLSLSIENTYLCLKSLEKH